MALYEKLQVDEVQLLMPDGRVAHFKKSLDDAIIAHRTNTQIGSSNKPITYYTIIVTPCEGTNGVDIL